MIYLDNSATSFIKPNEVKKIVKIALEKWTANHNRGAYRVSQETSQKVIETRNLCKKLFGESFECILTPGCSYALNLGMRGVIEPNSHIITTYLEHNSVLRVLEFLKTEIGISYTVLEKFDINSFESCIKENTKMVITTHISNVTGEKLDIKAVSKFCEKHNLIYLLDCAQSAGHIEDDYECVDILAFAGHKGLKSLTGVGGLMVKSNIKLKPILFGGTGSNSLFLEQPKDVPDGFETGTLGTIPIISLGEGIKYYLKNKKNIEKKEKYLTNYLIKRLKELSYIKTYINPENCFGVCSFNLLNFDSGLIADLLAEQYDICVRSGLHCAPLVHKHYNTINQGMIRVSLNEFNTKEEIDRLINALDNIYKTLIN